MKQIAKAQKAWDVEKKQELVKLGESKKPYNEILQFLENEIATSKKMTNFDYQISCFKNDGIYQLYRAIEETIGASEIKDEKKPSDDGVNPINTVDIKLANGIRKKIPYGKIALPEMGKDAQITIGYDSDTKKLIVRGTCQFRYQHLIDTIIDRTKVLLNTDSIYKYQAFEINQAVNEGQPELLDLADLNKEVMILSEETEYALSPLTARIHYPDKCTKKGIPLKFGCILEGPYGTGKTLLAFKLAEQAIAKNWSFIYLKSPKLLAETLRMSKTLDKNGNGIIVFVEDIDQVTKGERTAALQDILNTLDGGDTKNMNVIALFTTNHLDQIEPTFLRGKRIGTIISLTYLDAKTAKKYVEHFCQGITLEGDFEKVYQHIENSNIAPAFMAEIIENVKSNLILRDDNTIKDSHFMVCINSYLKQVALSKTKDLSQTPEKLLAASMSAVLHDSRYYDTLKVKIHEQLVLDELV